ncbi:SOS response-associated peptidase [Microbacterium amylolyticum]|uniref:Abasic site processing protein n=1 Tax=Microbacterium amylolyticum TaxID=936337 RepID=A0ABS4ZEJ1_9MICO|nr:SOS response-associated peptidase [Microbacterium amylolyticum]MBP2435669.1 putative SOS response-associated peptidase YedK [Microbacterium amylolyticum]
MCGRFVVAKVGNELVGELRADHIADNLPAPSYNIAPTQSAAIVLDSSKTEPPTRRLESARWGLVPRWAKDLSIGQRAFNARAEELEHKKMFAPALQSRRAVIPATGYYEWKTTEEGKVPLFVHSADGDPVLFAGLYEWWRNPEAGETDPARWVLSFTILTREAVGRLGSVHHRMPVFLDVDHADAWLDTDTSDPRDVLDAGIDDAPRVAESLAWHEVGTAVGNVRNNDATLIKPL